MPQIQEETPAEKKARENMEKVQAKEKEKKFTAQQKEARSILEKVHPALVAIESLMNKVPNTVALSERRPDYEPKLPPWLSRAVVGCLATALLAERASVSKGPGTVGLGAFLLCPLGTLPLKCQGGSRMTWR